MKPGPLARAAAATPRIFVGLLTLVCAARLWRVVATLGMRVPFDPNEGWNAYHAAAAMAGERLYPDGWMVNNYPPLSFYVVGLLGRAFGDAIIAGRFVSLLSFFAAAVCIAGAARIMGCRALDAALAALLFMSCLLVTSDYVGMDDPQMLGHALELAGAVVVLRAPRAVVLGAAPFVLALFVKHNLVALPLSLAMWLLLYDRRNAWRFIASGVGLSLAGLLAFRIGFGSSLFSHLVASRTYSFALLTSGLDDWLVWGTVPLAIAAILFTLCRQDRHVVFCTLYAAIALVFGVAFAGGAGVDANAFFDADIALALACGLALNRLAREGVVLSAALAVALMFPLAWSLALASADEDWRDPDYWFHPLADDAVLARSDITFFAQHRGRAMCEMLSLCYWAGKRAEVDMFNVQQQFVTHARNDDGLAREIDNHAFASVQLDSLEPFALTPRIRTALLAAYRVDHTDDDGVFLVPR